MTRTFLGRRAIIALVLAAACSNDPVDENSNHQQADLGQDVGQDLAPDLPEPLPPKFPGPCTISSDRGTDGTIESITTLRYDERGNPIEVASDGNADGIAERVTTYTYDEVSRLLRSEHDSPAGPPVERTVSNTYDEMGRLLRVERTDSSGTGYEDYSWDGLTATVSVDIDGDGIADGTNIETYDAAGNRVRSTWDFRSDQMLEQVDVWTYQNGLLVEFTSSAMGMLGTRLTYQYDEAGNLIGEQSDLDGDGTFDFLATYENDERGNPLRNVSGDDTAIYDYSCWE